MPGFEAKLGAPVVDKVVLRIKPAVDELRFAVGIRPCCRQPAFRHGPEGGQEGRANGFGKGEIGLPIAGVQIIIKDAADTARPAAMGDEEVFVSPSLEAVVIGRIMGIAGAFSQRNETRLRCP